MPLTSSQLDTITRTVLGEANANDPLGEAAVASVIKNRAESGNFPVDPAAVATQSNGSGIHQFSAWNSAANQGNNEVNIPASSPRYQAVSQIVQGVFDGNIPDPTNGATYYHTPAVHPSWDQGMTVTAQLGGHIFYSPHPIPPADIPNADPGPVSPLPPPAWYGINASGSPDDRSLDPSYYPPSYTPVPLAPVLMNVSGSPDDRDGGLPFDSSTPINAGSPLPTVTAPSGNTYVAGNVYRTADGASFRANPDGSFTKVANTPRQTTPLQLLIESQAPGARQNLENTVNSIQNVAQTAGSALSKLWGGITAPAAPAFSPGYGSSGLTEAQRNAMLAEPAPAPAPFSPGYGSSGLTEAQNNAILAISPTPKVGTTPVPGLPNPYSTTGGLANASGSPDDRQAAEDARSTGSGIAGTVQLPIGITPPGAAAAEAQAVQANGGSHSSGPATSDDGGWSALLTAVGDAPFSSPTPAPTPIAATTHGADEGPLYTTRTKIEQVANPAYAAWLKDQNSAIYGVDGVDSPSLDANGNVVLPSSYVGATVPKAPAPPKTIAKPITVRIPVKPAAPAAAPAPVRAPISPIASTNGYTYVPNGNGGYTRAGVVNSSLTPAQQYAAAAAPALASQPNGAAGMGSSNPGVHSNGSLV